MTVRPLAGALGAVLLLAGVCRAEGDKVAVSFRAHWKAGDTVTRTQHETQTQSVKVLGADGKPIQDESRATETEVTYVLKCVEADAAGHITKGLVYFSEYASTSNGERDESLKGRTYELTGVGKARKAAAVGNTAKSESDAAMGWLAKNLGAESNDDDFQDSVAPKAPVGAGDALDVPMKPIADVLSKDMPIDLEKSSGKLTIEAVAPDSFTSAVELTLQSKGLPNPQTGTLMTWAEGGKAVLKIRESARPDGGAPSQAEMEMELSGTTTDQGGVTIAFQLAQKQTDKTVVGGEIPAAPEKPAVPAPEKPGAPAPAGPEKPGEPPAPAPDAPKPEK